MLRTITAPVRAHYRAMRTNQTPAYVARMTREWGALDKGVLRVQEAFEALDDYVDVSDPDVVLPNRVHALQTAEAMRGRGCPPWMVVTGLVHDLGKVMHVWGREEDGQTRESQWGIAGDTWAVNLPFPADRVICPEYVPVTAPGPASHIRPCFGHDEYLHSVLFQNRCTTLPQQALAMVRYHSCYPWHDRGAYQHAEAVDQTRMKPWIMLFNGFDLYSKVREPVPVDGVWPYYDRLLTEFFPDPLRW